MNENAFWLFSGPRMRRLELRGAAAVLRHRNQRVEIPNLAALLGELESTVRKRFSRDPALREMIGLVPTRNRSRLSLYFRKKKGP